MRILRRFADPALRAENVMLTARLGDAESVIRLQADRIAQQDALIHADERLSNRMNAIRPCLCGPNRWGHWRDGAIAGSDGVVGTADDNLVPER